MTQSHAKLSVALAVYNEAENIRACLESVKSFASEIIVVDGTSTDGTADIARELGAKVVVVENQVNFHINKQIAVDACTGDWILQLDADERVSTMLGKEIARMLESDQSQLKDVYYLKRRNYFLGRWMNKGGVYPDPVIRLFKKGKFAIPQDDVHTVVQIKDAGWMQEDLMHVADPNFARYLMRSNRYTTLQADKWLREDKLGIDNWTIFAYFTYKPLYRFFEIYVRHRGYVDGFPGLVFAFYSGLHLTSSYVKYWEQKRVGRTA